MPVGWGIIQAMSEALEDLMPVGRWSTVAQAYEHALVVLAMNRDCQVRPEDGQFVLEVEPEDASLVTRELELYEEEQRESIRPQPESASHSMGLEVALIWAASLVLVYLRQLADPGVTDRFLNSSQAVFIDHEWWRPFTALFLHGDIEHLVGNIAIGGFFGVMVAPSFGPWRAWSLILLTGYLGNLLNAWIHLPGAFRSLGASTATFGALGLVVGHALFRVWKTHQSRNLKALLVPLGVGLGLFGWWGVGGVDTDVTAHLFGAGIGLVLGFVVASMGRWETRKENEQR
jgi:membrane associated rhomboid family serine protease